MSKLIRTWNQPSTNIFRIWQSKVALDDIVKFIGLFSGVATSCVALSVWLRMATTNGWFASISYSIVMGCYVAGGFCVLAVVKLALIIPDIRRPADWEVKLAAPQRTLLGLPALGGLRHGTPAVSKPKAPTPTPPRPLEPPKHTTPISLPAATAAPLYTPPYVGATRQDHLFTTSGRMRSVGVDSSPYGSTGNPIGTPKQLEAVLNDFDRQAKPLMTPELGFGGHSATPPAVPPMSYPAFSLSPGLSMGSPSPLPLGSAVPTYRPSLQSRGGVSSSPMRADGRLTFSTVEEEDAALARLHTDRETMQVWIERFREWLAGVVLQPLVKAMVSAHTDVAETAQKLGWSGIQLTRLDSPGGNGSNEGDEANILYQMRQQLTNRLRSQPNVQAAETRACLQAVTRYQRLAQLLRGSRPPQMLPSSDIPRGYIPARIATLAEGTCLAEFEWNGGGTFQGAPWGPPMPNDSVLLLYLFGAFLDAPFWQFPLNDGHQETSISGPLYIGALPSRPAEQGYAILCTRQVTVPKGTVSVVCLPGVPQGHPMSFTTTIDSTPLFIISSYSAPFTALLSWLQHCKLHGGGMLGGRSLAFLGLDKVMAPAEAVYVKRRWWGLW